MEKAPVYDFVTEDGIGNTAWIIDDEADVDAISKEFADTKYLYIADGHHRSASAVRVGRKRRAQNPDFTGNEEFNFFLSVLFPASQLTILPYNRCVRDLNGLTTREFLRKANELGFVISAVPFPETTMDHSCTARLPEGWYRLIWKVTPEQAVDAVARLDAQRLQEDLLAPALGILDPRTDPRIYFVGGIRGTGELERDIASGKAAIAFAMRPSTIEQMMAVADAGATMPPKSTWFEPKLRSGLLIHTF